MTLILIVFLFTLSFPNFSIVQSETGNVSYFLKSTVQYSNPSQDQVWNFTERGDYDRTIGLFMNSSWQTVELVNSTFTVDATKKDEDGNSLAVLQFPKLMLQPGENLNFTVWYHIVSKPRIIPYITETASLNLADIPQNLVGEYTRGEGSWQTNNQPLVSLASSLKGSETNVLTIVKNFIEWINTHGLSKTTVGFILLAFSGGIRGCNPFACAASLGASDTPGSFICFQQGRSRHRQK